jgi:acyl carrier protein
MDRMTASTPAATAPAVATAPTEPVAPTPSAPAAAPGTLAAPAPARSEIVERMRAIVAESLALEPDVVRPESRLVTDLGASSLDFIDMVFMVEKRFGVKLREGELDFFQRLDFGSPAVMREGFLTLETVERLAPWLPSLSAVPDRARVTPRELFGLITVETLVLLVERRIAAGEISAT